MKTEIKLSGLLVVFKSNTDLNQPIFCLIQGTNCIPLGEIIKDKLKGIVDKVYSTYPNSRIKAEIDEYKNRLGIVNKTIANSEYR